MRRLSLDHITAVDATPAELAELAARTGCAGICPFLHGMAVLPAMPGFDLTTDAAALAATRRAARDAGVTIDLVYPFTLAGRTDVAGFAPALVAAEALGARLANVLCYDREPARRIDNLGRLAALAAAHGVALAIEFYPPSQVRSLADALATVAAAGRSDIGVTLDLLHLVRAGEWPGAPGLRDPAIRLAQLCDGPAAMAADRIEWEAGIQRLLPGEGVFAPAGFVAALDPELPLSVEVPQQAALAAGMPVFDRARRAVDAVSDIIEGRIPA